jgi:L-ascorbate metabolism protein UlaG (beta-lactamase superfamily)
MLSNEIMQRLADAIDVLFVTHCHSDHYDLSFAKMLLAQNKPVITPPDLWADQPVYNKLLHLQRDAGKVQKVTIPLKGIDLDVVIFPGHQEEMLNNVYLIYSPEGITFLHTGDQSNSKDFEWIDHVGDHHKVDILMINSWSVYPEQRYAKGYRPRLIIPGHENELGHTIDHREPYWLNDNRLGDKTIFPWIQMVWGEKYHYLPKKSVH